MIRKTTLATVLMLGTSLSTTLYAAEIKINGTIPGSVTLHALQPRGLAETQPVEKPIVFQRVNLSQDAKQLLAAQVDKQIHSVNKPKAKRSELPTQYQVGMNGVPVLDQGQHGTCVTFAVTGAIDAASSTLNKGYDQYSQLCSLELGKTLEKTRADYPSGWDGSWGSIVLAQVLEFGLITKEHQEKKGCAGVFDYPTNNPFDTGRAMSTFDYYAARHVIIPPLTYNLILETDDAFTSKANGTIDKVKEALASGHHVTFGVLLDVGQGSNGALGTYKTRRDTWILTPEIAEDAKKGYIDAGHEMIITGYDDEAQVSGPDGKHKGVFTLRNSWGPYAGDKGNYYMTYDHFEALTLEAAEIFDPLKK